jgi:hypothetical protein
VLPEQQAGTHPNYRGVGRRPPGTQPLSASSAARDHRVRQHVARNRAAYRLAGPVASLPGDRFRSLAGWPACLSGERPGGSCL